MQILGRIIMRIEDCFCSRLFLRILLQNVRNQTFICEDFEEGVGWYTPIGCYKCFDNYIDTDGCFSD